jgi:hypothetical protein
MRKSLRKQLIWQGAALLSYFVGMILFLVVVMRVVTSPEQSLATLTTGDVTALVVSVFFLGVGGLLSWKSGGTVGSGMGPIQMEPTQGPEQSKLEELGYQMPPDDPDESEPTTRGAVGHDDVRCPECGATNDRSFTYCKQCSSELPGSATHR